MPNRHGVAYATEAGRRYEAYIHSKAWAKRRQQYWKQYGRSCKVSACEAITGLHVHHHTYDRLGQELMTDLVGLCEKHHMEVHDLHEKDGSISLTKATEMVTGLDLRRATKAKKAKKDDKSGLSPLAVKHQRSTPKKSILACCPCETCTKRRHPAWQQKKSPKGWKPSVVGKKPGPFDSDYSNPKTDLKRVQKPLRRVLKGQKRADERQQVIASRTRTKRRHEESVEIAGRIAAVREAAAKN